MSQDYTQLVPYGPFKVSGTDDTKYGYIPGKNYDYLIAGAEGVVEVAGTETDTKIVIETDESTPTVLCELATINSAAKTQFSSAVTEANRPITAGTGVVVRLDSAGNDASHIAWVIVWGTPGFI